MPGLHPAGRRGSAAGGSMTKEAFLADPHVKEMQPWVAARFDSTSGWTHKYVDRRTGKRWSCESLTDAFRQYRWNRESWRENKTKLDAYRRNLREAVGDNNVDRAADACERILRWGGLWARNGAHLRRRRLSLLDELRHLQAVIDGDHTPSPSEMRRNPSAADRECRMNAGFVKIYSLLCDHCVIYDGRVGAALGLLVRQFCEYTGRTAVPRCLAFAFGSSKEAPNAVMSQAPRRKPERAPVPSTEVELAPSHRSAHAGELVSAQHPGDRGVARQPRRGRVPRTRGGAVHGRLRPAGSGLKTSAPRSTSALSCSVLLFFLDSFAGARRRESGTPRGLPVWPPLRPQAPRSRPGARRTSIGAAIDHW